jgi:methionyl-tRNA synthetase
MSRFFVTTPIYYTNAVPTIGNAYASLLADILARYHRLLGEEVKFST